MQRGVSPHPSRTPTRARGEDSVTMRIGSPDKTDPPARSDSSFLRIRTYNVLLLTWIAYAAYVASRRPFSVVRHDLQGRLGLSQFELGVIDTLFLVNYCVGQLCYGMVKGWLSPKPAISLGLIGCSVWLSLFARSENTGFPGLCVWWGLNGLFNAFGWPSCMR
eukprot:Hpha_TRINITY_DN32977_c0_g1::TRINITY_DN32977_c0_g1_i1::g.113298::m.113298